MTNQKLYLIPTTPSYEYEPYNHIYLVTASSDQEAYEKAKTTLDANIPQELSEYESYDCYTEFHHLPSYPFHESEKYDILNSIFLNTKGLEHMAYFNVNWNDYTDELSKSQSKNHLNTSEINTFFTTLNPQIMFIYRSHIFYHQTYIKLTSKTTLISYPNN